MRKIQMYLLPITFFCIIFGGFVVHVLTVDRPQSEMENRTLESANLSPSPQEILSGAWSKQVETYISDQFPARDTWMRNYVYYQRAMGKTYLNDKYAVDDKSGWIISKPAEEKPDEELAYFATDLQKLSEGLAEKNIPFTYYSLPAKATYSREPSPSYMPEDAGVANNLRLHEFVTAKGVDNVRLYDEMKNNDFSAERNFFKTDHHWTIRGAYSGYQALMKTMSERLGETIEPIPYNEANTYCLPNKFAGSWNKILYMTVNNRDQVCYNEPASFATQFTIHVGSIEDGVTAPYDAVYGRAKKMSPETVVNYAEAYSRDFSELTIVNNHYDSDKHIVVIKDSYFNTIQFHVASHFKELTILDLRYLDKDAISYLQSLHPDYVVLAYNDRNLRLMPE
ncbi:MULTISPECIES: DHHW family protein [unclassified Lysinibacillus]|uniref:DHHW family protein n=1 Tax=unclassified Lysinibacillus TaxID=2636778 RepID=UPI002012D442|nr:MULTISPECIES: DHHW family protein [unclassified Lysinibacillus]MCL1695864.1 DHHW family protein [Lysinibacillus sp. BPa_S21]MCL1699890.1 DHHW family protein [Lysinibacillus sp. Bpr_S20]